MEQPLVSIILPTYNRAKLLPRTLESVLGQSYSNWELIVVDDGSEDETPKVLESFARRHGAIFFFRKPHSGVATTLNFGLKLARGKFVTFLGSDDEYLPPHLELRVKFMKAHSDIDLIHGGIKIVGNPYVPDKRDASKKIHLKYCIIGGTFFGKRNVFLKLGGFRNIAYSEDSDFFERAKKIFTIQKVEYPTYVYYRNVPDSVCNTIGV
jgi:glycosyltransferase involved in cell wall biosynthesis